LRIEEAIKETDYDATGNIMIDAINSSIIANVFRNVTSAWDKYFEKYPNKWCLYASSGDIEDVTGKRVFTRIMKTFSAREAIIDGKYQIFPYSNSPAKPYFRINRIKP
jgi:hypothetical protein